MKQFLRYQISGITFFIWVIVYKFGNNNWNIIESIFTLFTKDNEVYFKNLKYIIPAIVVLAIPVGTIIHQLSVLLKNWILNDKVIKVLLITAMFIASILFYKKEFYEVILIITILFLAIGINNISKNTNPIKDKNSILNDFPSTRIINKIENNRIEYCLDRISNLNSFYYVRFDNSILAPIIAIIIVSISDCTIKLNYIFYFLLIALITGIYIIRIKKEMIIYRRIILDSEEIQNLTKK